LSDDRQIAAWIEGARRGEAPATQALGEYVHALAREVCRPHSASLGGAEWEDVAQEAAIRVFSSGMRRYEGTGSARGYLYSIIKSSLLQTIRGVRRRRAREAASEVSSAPPALHGGPHRKSSSLDVAALLARLEEECRSLIERVFFEGVAYARLSQESGLAESSIRARLSRCLRRLRESSRG
jgi:RNA polymerase sigma-70 factor (ECF subfamily)